MYMVLDTTANGININNHIHESSQLFPFTSRQPKLRLEEDPMANRLHRLERIDNTEVKSSKKLIDR